jgi:hypothetical protein
MWIIPESVPGPQQGSPFRLVARIDWVEAADGILPVLAPRMVKLFFSMRILEAE